MKSNLTTILFSFLVLPILTAGGCAENPPKDAITTSPHPDIITPATHHELSEFLTSHNYDWKNLEEGVPPFILKTFPPDFDRIPQITEKKRIFFLSLLPMVLLINKEIDHQRKELIRLFELYYSGEILNPEQKALVTSLARENKIEEDPLTNNKAREKLLKRLDVIPPSVVLAQAANESAYGTSRFARIGNNLFGQWTFTPGTGLIPEKRPAGKSYEVRRFANLYSSIHSYIKNINTHWAYKPLRDKRALMRAKKLPLRGIDLAQGLEPYSIRGEAYVKEICAIIRKNHLSLLTSATLRDYDALSPAQKTEPTKNHLSASLVTIPRTLYQNLHP